MGVQPQTEAKVNLIYVDHRGATVSCVETVILGKMQIFYLRYFCAYLTYKSELRVYKHFMGTVIVPINAYFDFGAILDIQSLKMPFSVFFTSLVLLIML